MNVPRSHPLPMRLVLHHRYGAHDQAVDLSGHGNDGRVLGACPAQPGVPITPPGLRFDGHTTRVVVPPSESLRCLGALRVDARLLLEPGKHRRTIVEGFLAFSFFVEPNGALGGTVYTGQHWYGAYSEPGLVPDGQVVELGFLYDGEVTSLVQIGGRTVAVSQRPLGPVRTVEWPFGLNVGGWPDGDRRMFRGIMSELKVRRSRT